MLQMYYTISFNKIHVVYPSTICSAKEDEKNVDFLDKKAYY